MIKAADKDGKLYTVYQAEQANLSELFCPFCKTPVTAKHYEDRRNHFAHRNEQRECLYHVENPMTDWHLHWQERFPEQNREVILQKNNEKHIADVLVNNLVIEFQHSNISYNDFKNRNVFYKSLGYSVIWVFDFLDKVLSEQVYQTDDNEYCWDNPAKTFRSIDPKKNEVTIYIQVDDDSQYAVLKRVSNVYKSFKQFYTDEKREFTISGFVNHAIYSQNKLFQFNADPDIVKRGFDLGGKAIEKLWSPKYKWIQVQNVCTPTEKYYIMGKKEPPHEILRNAYNVVKGKIRFAQEFVTIFNATLPIWKIINSKDRN